MRKLKRFLGIFFMIGYTSSGAVAHAATYYVANNGSDFRSCGQAQSASTPKFSLNNAVSCLQAGDTLYVRAGVYAEALLFNIPSGTSWSNKVRIAAYPGETVTMRPSATPFLLQFAGSSNLGHSGGQQYIEFDGINLDGTSVLYDVVRIDTGPGYNAHHIRIKNATITAVAQYPGHARSEVVLITGMAANAVGFNEFQHVTLTGGGPVDVGNDYSHMFYIQTPDNLIEDSIIENGIGAGVHLYNSNQPGTAPDRTIIRNNIIRNFTTSPSTRSWGIIAASGNGHQIYNNLIYNIAHLVGESAAISLYIDTNTQVYNNTVYGNAGWGIVVEPDAYNATVRNNIAYANAHGNIGDFGSYTYSTNNLTTDPRFVSSAGGDFRLRSDSPAIDQGAYIGSVQYDQLGVPRPQGNGFDIGAYEFNWGGAAPAPPAPDPPAPSGSASPDATRIPGASSIVDNSLAVWTLGSGREILRNGAQAAGGYGFGILWFQGNIYVVGDDSRYWRWTGSTWAFASATDPSGGASAGGSSSSSSSGSSSSPTASPSGTRVPTVASILDNSLAAWTLGPSSEILRNGSQVVSGFASQILWFQNVIYVRGDDLNWWRFTGITWSYYGPNAPG